MTHPLRFEEVFKCHVTLRMQKMEKGPYDTVRAADFFTAILENHPERADKKRLSILDAIAGFGFESWYLTWLANALAAKKFRVPPLHHYFVYVVARGDLLDHWQRFDPDRYADFQETIWWKYPIFQHEDRNYHLIVMGDSYVPVYQQYQGSTMTEFVAQSLVRAVMADYMDQAAEHAAAMDPPLQNPETMIFEYMKTVAELQRGLTYEEFEAAEIRYRDMLLAPAKKFGLAIPMFKVGGI
jgi:hypothetical protein